MSTPAELVANNEIGDAVTTSVSKLEQRSMDDELIAEEDEMSSDGVEDGVDSWKELLTQLDRIRSHIDLKTKERTHSGASMKEVLAVMTAMRTGSSLEKCMHTGRWSESQSGVFGHVGGYPIVGFIEGNNKVAEAGQHMGLFCS